MDTQIGESYIVRNNGKLFTALWSSVGVTIWQGAPDHDFLDQFEEDIAAFRKRLPYKFTVMILAEDSVEKPPPDSARERLERITKQTSERVLGVATVIKGMGFQASITRGIATSMNLLDSKTHRRTFDSVPLAADWLAELLGRDKEWASKLELEVSKYRKLSKAA